MQVKGKKGENVKKKRDKIIRGRFKTKSYTLGEKKYHFGKGKYKPALFYMLK